MSSGGLVRFTATNGGFMNMSPTSGTMGGEASMGGFPIPGIPRQLGDEIPYPSSGAPRMVQSQSSVSRRNDYHTTAHFVVNLLGQMKGISPLRGELIFHSLATGQPGKYTPATTLSHLNALLKQSFRDGIISLDSKTYDGVGTAASSIIENLAKHSPNATFSPERVREITMSLQNYGQTEHLIALAAPLIQDKWTMLGPKLLNKVGNPPQYESITIATSGRTEIINYWGSRVKQGAYLWLVLTRRPIQNERDFELNFEEFRFLPVWTRTPSFENYHQYRYRNMTDELCFPDVIFVGKVIRVLRMDQTSVTEQHTLSACGLTADSIDRREDNMLICGTLEINFGNLSDFVPRECP